MSMCMSISIGRNIMHSCLIHHNVLHSRYLESSLDDRQSIVCCTTSSPAFACRYAGFRSAAECRRRVEEGRLRRGRRPVGGDAPVASSGLDCRRRSQQHGRQGPHRPRHSGRYALPPAYRCAPMDAPRSVPRRVEEVADSTRAQLGKRPCRMRAHEQRGVFHGSRVAFSQDRRRGVVAVDWQGVGAVLLSRHASFGRLRSGCRSNAQPLAGRQSPFQCQYLLCEVLPCTVDPLDHRRGCHSLVDRALVHPRRDFGLG